MEILVLSIGPHFSFGEFVPQGYHRGASECELLNNSVPILAPDFNIDPSLSRGPGFFDIPTSVM